MLATTRLLNSPPFQIVRFASQFLLTHVRQDVREMMPISPSSLPFLASSRASWAACHACLPENCLLLPGSSVVITAAVLRPRMRRMRVVASPLPQFPKRRQIRILKSS